MVCQWPQWFVLDLSLLLNRYLHCLCSRKMCSAGAPRQCSFLAAHRCAYLRFTSTTPFRFSSASIAWVPTPQNNSSKIIVRSLVIWPEPCTYSEKQMFDSLFCLVCCPCSLWTSWLDRLVIVTDVSYLLRLLKRRTAATPSGAAWTPMWKPGKWWRLMKIAAWRRTLAKLSVAGYE